jgi:nucleoside-diphosphate-sugar epimerase
LKNQLSVIGCGWLGLPLANYLITEGYSVKGSTTTKDKLKTLKQASIEGFVVNLNETCISGNYSDFLKGSETVIINIPPGLRKHPTKNHIAEIQHLISAIEAHNIKNVLYISTTSVFDDKDHFPVINNNTKPNGTSKSSKQLITIEQQLFENPNVNTTILRFGGLFDMQRHPAKYLSGKKNITNPSAPINLIHKEDCIGIISAILKNNLWNVALNATYPYHPKKETYYTDYCKRYNLELPEFDSSKKSVGKLIDSSKLVRLLNYTFQLKP